MQNTLDPNKIYDAFDKHGFSVLRIDNFDRGDYAEIRAELSYKEYLTVNQLQEITLKLNLIEKNEEVELRIVHIDMFHKTLRVNIHIDGKSKSADKLGKTEPIIQFYRTSDKSEREIEIVEGEDTNEETEPIIEADEEIGVEEESASVDDEDTGEVTDQELQGIRQPPPKKDQ
jgi:hypothetical protein